MIAAALSIQDPRERPPDKQQAADQAHRRFADDRSDFLTYWRLWSYLQEQQKRAVRPARSAGMCRAEFLHYLRVREWQELHGQLPAGRAKRVGDRDAPAATRAAAARPEPLHTSLLAGLLSHIGLWDPDKREYVGARGARFVPWPGSALFKKPPRWVMAGELVETSRLWGRDLGARRARVGRAAGRAPGQALLQRAALVEQAAAPCMAYEKVTLYGVPLVAAARSPTARIDPELSRELFIRHALVQGEWRTHHAFFARQPRAARGGRGARAPARRRDILVDDETLFDFYDERVPADVVSARHFDSWWKTARREQPDLLDFERAMLLREDASRSAEDEFPDHVGPATWRCRCPTSSSRAPPPTA